MTLKLARRLLPVALSTLLLTACASDQTLSSLERTERPALPNLPTELSKTETLKPITTGTLDDYAQRHGEAAGAVANDNARITGFTKFYACVKQAIATGKVADDCLPSAK